jgi:hypothetical protein
LGKIMIGRRERELARRWFLSHLDAGIVDHDLPLSFRPLRIGSGSERDLPIALPRGGGERRDPAGLC